MPSHYRVTIFGSARIRPGDRTYEEVYEIARGLAGLGYDVVTGGGPGLMQAANAGHQSVDDPAVSIGLNIRLPREQVANPYLDIKRDFDRFSGRLDTFMALSDAVVVAPGGIGTLLELFYAWQLVQVGHVPRTPIVLFGELWRPFLHWMNAEVLGRGLIDAADLEGVFHVAESPHRVIELIRRLEADRSSAGDVGINFRTYRVDGTPLEEADGG